MPGRYLIVDSSTPAGSLALCENGQVLAEYLRHLPGTHTEWLLQAIEYLLDQAGMRPDQLDAIAGVIGPGSFTGLRVGLATVKGLAMAAGLPVVPLSSLELLACGLPYATDPVCALLDARKQEVYSGLFDLTEGIPVAITDEAVLPPEELAARLEPTCLLVGEGAFAYRDRFETLLSAGCQLAPRHLACPRAALAAELVAVRLQEDRTVDAASLVPRYLRASEAERARNMEVSAGIDG
ncbi:MAG: tRNA (adenosine(37)-N6)-threonylcarbamoyltransferase complex dimerization subunit type 1 TsaB [Geothermobacteraceae bacterium]